MKEVCSTRGQLRSRDRPRSRAGENVLMTKRSCTPLATVSDNESEDGSTPRDGSGGDTQRSNSSAGSKRESPQPMTSGYFATTLNYIRPRRTPTSPRTAVSLDNVDLWEEDDSDSDERRPSPGFDRINGVPINPRVTIDFSELRRSRSPVATKRNKLDDHTGCKSAAKPFSSKTLAELKSDMAAAKTRLMESRNKPRVRVNRKLQATTLFPNPDRSGNGQPINHQARTEASEIKELRSPIEKQKSSQSKFQFMPRLSSTYTVSELKSAMVAPPNNASSNATVSTAKNSELNRINSKIAALRTVTNNNTKIHRNAANLIVNTQQSPIVSLREDIKRVKDMNNRGSTDSNMSTGSASSSPERKVKFNNFVTIREGEKNTMDHLRESHNSAQVFKQKYLGTSTLSSTHNRTVRKSPESDDSRDGVQGALRIELVC